MEINLLAVFVVSLFSFLLGRLWYSKFLFADLFMKYMEKREEEIQSINKISALFYEFSAVFITNYVIASILILIDISNFWRGFQLGIILWIGLVAMPQLSIVIAEKRNFSLFFIQIIYRLAAISVSSGILAVWK